MQSTAFATRIIGVMQQAALADCIIYKYFIKTLSSLLNSKSVGVHACSNVNNFVEIDLGHVACSLLH
jgi:hypothetical protein